MSYMGVPTGIAPGDGNTPVGRKVFGGVQGGAGGGVVVVGGAAAEGWPSASMVVSVAACVDDASDGDRCRDPCPVDTNGACCTKGVSKGCALSVKLSDDG